MNKKLRSKGFWLSIILGFIVIWSIVDLFLIVPNLDSK